MINKSMGIMRKIAESAEDIVKRMKRRRDQEGHESEGSTGEQTTLIRHVTGKNVREILDEKTRIDGYRFFRVPIDYLPEQETCPYGQYFYELVLGDNFDFNFVNEVVSLADEETRRIGARCGGVDSEITRSSIMKFAHAVEHLVFVDLVDRNVAKIPATREVETCARTICGDKKIFGFYIRKGITTPEEELVSLNRVVERLNKLK